MQKFEKANFNVKEYDETENYGKFVIEPLERGFGTTLGNSLRRVLLSSIPGCAVHAIKVQGAIHEFSAVDGIVEDVTSIILNIKKLVFKIDGEEEKFGNSDYTWVCDPVDGTAMYARHIPVAVFSLALVVNGVPNIFHNF